jgi:hypothetical protein
MKDVNDARSAFRKRRAAEHLLFEKNYAMLA